MKKSPLKYLICISTLFFLLSCLSIPAFSQQNELKGITKRKAFVYFGTGNRTKETITKGTNVTILDADSNYLTIKYKEGKAFVMRDDIQYNKEEINKIVDLKEKNKAAIAESIRKAKEQKEKMPIHGITLKKTPVYRGASEKKVDEIGKGKEVLITGKGGNFFLISHNGEKSRIFKTDIKDANKLDSLIGNQSKDSPSEAIVLNNSWKIDPLTSAGDLLITSSNCRLAGMAISFASAIAISTIKDEETIKMVSIAGGVAGLGLIIASEVMQIKAGKMLRKKGLSFSTTNNGIGMVYKF